MCKNLFHDSDLQIKLLKLPLSKIEKRTFNISQKNGRNPVLWFGRSQMSGDEIFLTSNIKTKKLDSLKIIGNSWIIEKDSINDEGFNQIKGGILNGSFTEGKLKDIEIIKNTEVIYYMYSDDKSELIGINQTTCSRLTMVTANNQIVDITFYVSPDGDLFPEKDLPQNERILEGFIWREDERPNEIDDLFSEEDNLYVPREINVIETPEDFLPEILKP